MKKRCIVLLLSLVGMMQAADGDQRKKTFNDDSWTFDEVARVHSANNARGNSLFGGVFESKQASPTTSQPQNMMPMDFALVTNAGDDGLAIARKMRASKDGDVFHISRAGVEFLLGSQANKKTMNVHDTLNNLPTDQQLLMVRPSEVNDNARVRREVSDDLEGDHDSSFGSRPTSAARRNQHAIKEWQRQADAHAAPAAAGNPLRAVAQYDFYTSSDEDNVFEPRPRNLKDVSITSWNNKFARVKGTGTLSYNSARKEVRDTVTSTFASDAPNYVAPIIETSVSSSVAAVAALSVSRASTVGDEQATTKSCYQRFCEMLSGN